MAAYFAQQRRWATGVFEVLRRYGRLIFLPGDRYGSLSTAQRIQYFLSCTHYLSGVCNLVYLLVPLLFFYIGACAVRPVEPGLLFGYLLPYWLLALLTFRHASGGRLHWHGTTLGFGSFPVTVSSLVSVLSGQRVRFVVTAKKWRPAGQSLIMLVPHGLAFVFCLGGLFLSLSANGNPLFVILSGLWLVQMAGMLAALLHVGLSGQGHPAAVPEEKTPLPASIM
jgi:cellulose synthase (UDP-forming)